MDEEIGLERLNNLPNVTQLVVAGSGLEVKSLWHQFWFLNYSPHLWFLLPSSSYLARSTYDNQEPRRWLEGVLCPHLFLPLAPKPECGYTRLTSQGWLGSQTRSDGFIVFHGLLGSSPARVSLTLALYVCWFRSPLCFSTRSKDPMTILINSKYVSACPS